MINIQDFNSKKEKGLARVIEVTDENIIVAYKQFDLEQAKMGIIAELPEEVSVQSLKELNDQKASLQAGIDVIDSLLNDLPPVKKIEALPS
jgi:hypothetical protein